MRLKRLEISGFKSFKDRVVFDFFPGITAIVGPNGCGKSNVVDALRWVMGEQKASSLRGKKIEDVIFHGAEGIPPVSLAEVTLILSRGEDQPFPEPYENCEEISISRKHFRDGESEYYINKIPCRLLDIQEFFMGTGVGARAYSIVEQSSIGQLIEAKPEERRLYIEEAAGISKYKTRKEAAAKKIEATKQNLARLNDIIREVKGQLSQLSRQAKKAEEFKALKKSLREGEITLAVHAYREFTKQEEKQAEALKSIEEEITTARAIISSYEAQGEKAKMEMAEEETAYLSLQEALYRLRNEIRIKEQESQHLGSKINDLKLQIKRNQDFAEEVKERFAKIRTQEEEISTALEICTSSLEEKKAALNDLEEELKLFQSEESDYSQEIESTKAKYVDLAAEKARLKNEEATLDRHLEGLKRQQEKDKRELTHLSGLINTISSQISDLEANIKGKESRLEDIGTQLKKIEGEVADCQGKLKEMDSEATRLRESLSRKSTRLTSLREFHDGYAWCNGATRTIMTSANPAHRGLVALVADCLSVQPGYERAVESALGEKLQYIIVKSIEDGVEAIHYLKEMALGRGHFVPLFLRGETPGRLSDSIPSEIEPLLSHVSAQEDFFPVVNVLLRDVFIVSDLKKAVALWSQNGFWGTLVTPEGDVVTPHGILSGGHQAGERSLFLDKREMDTLEEEIKKETTRLQETEDARRHLSTHIQRLLEEKNQLIASHHSLELNLSNLKKDRERLLGEKKRLAQTLKALEYNLLTQKREEEELERKKVRIKELLAAAQAREASITTELESLQKKATGAKLQRKRIEEEITQYRILVASLSEKRKALLQEKGRLEEEKISLMVKEAKLLEEIKEAERAITTLEQEQREIKGNINTLYGELRVMEGEINARKEKREALNAALQDKEEKIRSAKKNLQDLENQYRLAEDKKREIAYELRSLSQAIQEKYEANLNNFKDLPILSPDEISSLQEKLASVRQALENFGEVNLLAIEEYASLKERYDFLIAQANDLNQSINSLQRTIASINRLSRERFAETFSRVNASFQEIFHRVFPGGRGELILMDENNLLETGIDVQIQLPGKKLQHISLLSGGEKAMIAFSFILSFILCRPTPFLVLDEVDAALDDSNINLFVRLIKDIASSSQVIMITHNKMSMEAAHYLYGITMEQKGVSKVISVSLD